MMAVAGLELLGDILAVLTPGVPQRLMFVLNLVAGLSIAGLSAALVFGRWPQVVRPTALCFLSKVVANGLSMVATLLSSTVVASALVGVLPEAGQDVAASTAVVASSRRRGVPRPVDVHFRLASRVLFLPGTPRMAN